MTGHEGFFQQKQAAAVLKHGILSSHVTLFAALAGSTSKQRRVTYLDGYAGPGRYWPDGQQNVGEPGSPLLAVQSAERAASWKRDVRCIFVESNSSYMADLRRTLADEAPEFTGYELLEGEVEDHLDHALAVAGNDPLLAFLAPFGTALPYSMLTEKLLRREDGRITDVILNLNVEMVWRVGGMLSGARADEDDDRLPDGTSATLERLDRFFGDDWWRNVFRQARRDDEPGSAALAAQQVAVEFCTRIEHETGFQSVQVPIRRRPDHPPLFLMTLFYKHPAAAYEFSQSASTANEKWRRRLRQQDLAEDLHRLSDTPSLLDADDITQMSEDEARRVERLLDEDWIRQISNNVRTVLESLPVLSVQDDFESIYGNTLGLARDKHLTKAWDQLAEQGVVAPRETKKPRYQKIVRC